MFDATNIGKDNNKSKYLYSGYTIAFDGRGEWNFANDSARNVIVFAVDKSLSSHTDNCKNIFLVLGKRSVLILVKQRQNVAKVCITMVILVICLLTEKNP